MTPQELEALWQTGQQREAEGALDDARDAFRQILAGSPRQIMVQVRLSEIEQRAGNYRAARDYAVLARDTLAMTQRWEGLAFVTANLLVFDERGLVRDLITQAPWNDPRILGQSAVLSQQLWLCGDEEGALRMLDVAARRGASDHRLSYSRGMALQHLGRIDEATRAFEDSLRLKPDFALAHWSLAYHAAAPTPGARVERIRAVLAKEYGQLERAMLHYALYKELDDADQREAAWQELEAGAAAMRTLAPYSPDAVAAGVDAMLAMDAGSATSAANAGAASHTPIFIVGMPRTGTTLLSRIVAAHPAVADAGELNALEHAIGEQLDRFVELPLPADAVAALRDTDPAAIGEAYLRRTARHYGKATHLVDKNPINVFAAGIIAAAMPNARILCLSRNPMDTGYSNLRQLFQNGAFGYSYDQDQLAGHYAVFRRVVDHWAARLPGNFLEVSYEALVADPVGTAGQVFAFCGLDFDPAYVDITRNTSPSATASSVQIREPISAQNVGEWRRYADGLKPLQAKLAALGIAAD
jgi:tetratricopeptide (TPR) repeat protein